MKVAVFTSEVVSSGGGFQQALSTLRLLQKHQDKPFHFIFISPVKENISLLKQYGIKAFWEPRSYLRLPLDMITRNLTFNRLALQAGIPVTGSLDRTLKKYKADLVFFTSPTRRILDLDRHNYMVNVWDLCHLDHPEFPEVRQNREFEARQDMYARILPKAAHIITDSETGKSNIVKHYSVNPNRVTPLPFLPPVETNRTQVNIKGKYAIKGEYIFYPAQFWAHKNHIYILESLNILKRKRKINISAIFCGGNKGNFKHVRSAVKRLQLDDQIIFAGFVEDDIMPELYRQALALVMPTYFGPTNLPPLEAFHYGTPVVYSKLPGLSDQVKEAALQVNLKSPESLAKQLERLMKDEELKAKLTCAGRELLTGWTREEYWKGLFSIFSDYSVKLKTWKEISRNP